MLWLMHNTWWLYIQFFFFLYQRNVSIMQPMFISGSLKMSLVSFVSMLVSAVWHAISSRHTHFILFFSLQSFLTTSFCPFFTRPKRVLVHTRREVIKKKFKKKTLFSIQWKTKLCKQVSYKIYFMLELEPCALLSINWVVVFLHNIVHASDHPHPPLHPRTSELHTVLLCCKYTFVFLSFLIIFVPKRKDMSKDVHHTSWLPSFNTLTFFVIFFFIRLFFKNNTVKSLYLICEINSCSRSTHQYYSIKPKNIN